MLAAPIIDPIVALSTFAAFRGQHPGMVMSLKLTLGFIVACVVGTVVQRLPLATVLNSKMLAALPARPAAKSRSQKHRSLPLRWRRSIRWRREWSSLGSHPETIVESRELAHSGPTFRAKISGAIRCAAFDFLDVGFYLIIGAAIASVFNTAINKDGFCRWLHTSPVAVSGMMILARLLSLCSTSDAFNRGKFHHLPAGLETRVHGLRADDGYEAAFHVRARLSAALHLGMAAGLLFSLVCSVSVSRSSI